MRNIRMILAGIFLTGVLVSGVGVGIAIVEYSSFEYGGKKLLGEEYLATKDLDFAMEDDGVLVLSGSYYYSARSKEAIEEDPAVPEDVVRYRITYNTARMEPYLSYEAYARDLGRAESIADGQAPTAATGETDAPAASEEPEAAAYAGVLRLSFQYVGDEFSVLMENKDEILEDLKQKRVAEYEWASIEDIKILVNPKTMQRVEDRLWR